MSHTPGPWKFDENAGCRTVKGGKSGTHQQAQYTEIAFTVGLSNDDTDLANACLIASSPELLAALEKFERWFSLEAAAGNLEGTSDAHFISEARAAIKKAKGA